MRGDAFPAGKESPSRGICGGPRPSWDLRAGFPHSRLAWGVRASFRDPRILRAAERRAERIILSSGTPATGWGLDRAVHLLRAGLTSGGDSAEAD